MVTSPVEDTQHERLRSLISKTWGKNSNVTVSELDDAAMSYLMSRPPFAQLFTKPNFRQDLHQCLNILRGERRANKSIQMIDQVAFTTASAMLETYFKEYIHAARTIEHDEMFSWTLERKTLPLREIFDAMKIINRVFVKKTSNDTVFIEIATLATMFSILYTTKTSTIEAFKLGIKCFFGEALENVLVKWKTSGNGYEKEAYDIVVLMDTLVENLKDDKDRFKAEIEIMFKNLAIEGIAKQLSKYVRRNAKQCVQWLQVLNRLGRADLERAGAKQEVELTPNTSKRRRDIRARDDDEDDCDSGEDNVEAPRNNVKYDAAEERGVMTRQRKRARQSLEASPTAAAPSPRKRRTNAAKKGSFRELDLDESDVSDADINDKEVGDDVKKSVSELRGAQADLQETIGEDVLNGVIERAQNAKRRRRTLGMPESAGRAATPFSDDDSDFGDRPHIHIRSVARKKFPKSIKERPKSPPPRGSSKRFTREDDDELIRGLKKYGYGRWVEILNNGNFPESFTNSKLKDRARTLGIDAKDYPVRGNMKRGRGRPPQSKRGANKDDESDEYNISVDI